MSFIFTKREVVDDSYLSCGQRPRRSRFLLRSGEISSWFTCFFTRPTLDRFRSELDLVVNAVARLHLGQRIFNVRCDVVSSTTGLRNIPSTMHRGGGGMHQRSYALKSPKTTTNENHRLLSPSSRQLQNQQQVCCLAMHDSTFSAV